MADLHKTPPAPWGVWLALTAAALAWTLGGCEGERGEPGQYSAVVEYTSDVTEADLSELGITQAGSLPDADESFALTARSGRVFWTSDWQGPAVRYVVTVKLKKSKGERGESGLFPANDAVELPPLTADVGEDGKDVRLRILIRRDELHVFRAAEPQQGTPVD
jgi:hypothetical protein